jgi:hypothetical protein
MLFPSLADTVAAADLLHAPEGAVADRCQLNGHHFQRTRMSLISILAPCLSDIK